MSNDMKAPRELVTIRLDPPLVASLRALARRDDRTLSWHVREAVLRYVAAKRRKK